MKADKRMSSIQTQFLNLRAHPSPYADIDPRTTLKGSASGKADWAKGRYLSSNWDVDELLQMKDQIIKYDLLVNRLRKKG